MMMLAKYVDLPYWCIWWDPLPFPFPFFGKQFRFFFSYPGFRSLLRCVGFRFLRACQDDPTLQRHLTIGLSLLTLPIVITYAGTENGKAGTNLCHGSE